MTRKCVTFSDDTIAAEPQAKETRETMRRRSWDTFDPRAPSNTAASLPMQFSSPQMPKRQLSRTLFAIEDVAEDDSGLLSVSESENTLVTFSRSWSSAVDYAPEELRSSRHKTHRSMLSPPRKPERQTSQQAVLDFIRDEDPSAPSSTRSLPDVGTNPPRQARKTRGRKGGEKSSQRNKKKNKKVTGTKEEGSKNEKTMQSEKARGNKRANSKPTISPSSSREMMKRITLEPTTEGQQTNVEQNNIARRTISLLPFRFPRN